MKIAIPVHDGQLSLHFGHCDAFAMFDVDTEARTFSDPCFLTPPAHEPGALPRWLAEQGAGLIIAGGMGVRAQQLFAQAGIDVVVGASSEAPDALVGAWLEGTLAAGENICDH